MAPADAAVRIPTREPSTHRAERVMGTVVSLVAPVGGADGSAADRAFDWLHEVDRRFSPFRPDSEVNALIRDGLSPEAISADLREVLDTADTVRSITGGAFDIRAHRTDGAPDPTGIVKGWSVDRAARILLDGGMHRFAIDAGGDVLAGGGRSSERPWRVGVVDPADRSAVRLVLTGDDMAVATSGTGERGRHIRDGRTGAAVDSVASVTVVGCGLARADAYATAAFAMGREAVSWLDSVPGYEGIIVGHDRSLARTAGFDGYLAGAAAGQG